MKKGSRQGKGINKGKIFKTKQDMNYRSWVLRTETGYKVRKLDIENGNRM